MACRYTVFVGTFVHSKTLDEVEILHETAVVVDPEGKITYVGPIKAAAEGYDGVASGAAVDVYRCRDGHFFFPGFIDTHIHASQYPNVGIFGKTTLMDWLNTYTFPLESSLKDPVKAGAVYRRVIQKTLSHGTTCASYFATINVDTTNLLADLCFRAGQRALVGRVCMDQLSPDWYKEESAEASVAASRASIDYIHKLDPSHSLVRPIITPRFAPTCSAPLMKALGKLAAETSVYVQTHVSENQKEIALVRELHPPSSTGAEDDSYTSVYDACGILTERTILAHGVHLSEAEAELIASRKAKVSHCPCSNSSITSGAARIRWLLNKGITCGLGTDVSGGYSPSILEAARQAALVSRHVAMGGDDLAKLSVEEVLYLATVGGAEVVGLQDRVGRFAVGMDFDAQLIGLTLVSAEGGVEPGEESSVDVFGWESWDDLVHKWLYCGDDRNTKKVWVKGRLVHERTAGGWR
ncbi:guanine deaminase [Thozetella sp. PMI_491]|nr:guanine deaminase [Thozetella sp. PMI_491]